MPRRAPNDSRSKGHIALQTAESWQHMAEYKESIGQLKWAESYWRMAAGYYQQAGHAVEAIHARQQAKELKKRLDKSGVAA